MPKLLDPFTGHEAKGSLASEFAELFKKKSYERFEGLIEDFNQLITSDQFREASFRCLEQLKDSVDIQDADFGKFEQAIAREFEPISIST